MTNLPKKKDFFDHDIYGLVRTEENSPDKRKGKPAQQPSNKGSKSGTQIQIIESPPSRKRPTQTIVPPEKKKKPCCCGGSWVAILGLTCVFVAIATVTAALVFVFVVKPGQQANLKKQQPQLQLQLAECTVLSCENGFCVNSTCNCWGGHPRSASDIRCLSLPQLLDTNIQRYVSELDAIFGVLTTWSQKSGIVLTGDDVAPVVRSIAGLKTEVELVGDAWPLRDFYALRYDKGDFLQVVNKTDSVLDSISVELHGLLDELNLATAATITSRLQMKGANHILWDIRSKTNIFDSFKSFVHLVQQGLRASPLQMFETSVTNLLNSSLLMEQTLQQLDPQVQWFGVSANNLLDLVNTYEALVNSSQNADQSLTNIEGAYQQIQERAFMVAAAIQLETARLLPTVRLSKNRILTAYTLASQDHRMVAKGSPEDILLRSNYSETDVKMAAIAKLAGEDLQIMRRALATIKQASDTVVALSSFLKLESSASNPSRTHFLSLALAVDRLGEILVYFNSLASDLDQIEEIFNGALPVLD